MRAAAALTWTCTTTGKSSAEPAAAAAAGGGRAWPSAVADDIGSARNEPRELAGTSKARSGIDPAASRLS